MRVTLGERVNDMPYQWIIKKLEIADVECHGAPMSSGGSPQVLELQQILLKSFDKVEVFGPGGSQIF